MWHIENTGGKTSHKPVSLGPPLPAPFFLMKLCFAMAGRGLLFSPVEAPDWAAFASDLPIWAPGKAKNHPRVLYTCFKLAYQLLLGLKYFIMTE